MNESTFLFAHNKETYEQLETILSTDNKAIVVLGTGIGKTTTALEYLHKHNIRGLVICPQHAIKEGWDKLPNYVDTITYSMFAKTYMEIDFSKYGALICDEVHHVGAETWGAGIKYVINNNLCKVIGLTATPERTDGIDVINDIFAGNVCQGLDMLGGIKNGIIHPFTYVGAYYDTDGLKKEVEDTDRINSDSDYKVLCGKLDLAINNTPNLNTILTSNMPEGKRKIIVFVSDINAIAEAKQILDPIFPLLEHKELHSNLNIEDTLNTRQWFKDTDEGLLYTVNMASEGIHYPGVNTLIMFRRTMSSIVFNQQLGRISTLTKYANPNAIVFDLVNNAKTISNFKAFINDSSSNSTGNGTKAIFTPSNLKSNQIIVKDYTTEITEVLEELKTYDDDSWKEEEDEILKTYYPIEGAVGCQKRLLNRSINEISWHATNFLGLRYVKNRYDLAWTDEEDELLKKYYPIYGAKKCIKYFTNRSAQSILCRANHLGLRVNFKKKWEPWEEKAIIDYYTSFYKNDNSKINLEGLLKILPHRSKTQIINKANLLVTCKKKHSWTEEEDSIINQFYSIGGAELCLQKLGSTDLTKDQILQRASKLKVKVSKENIWTPEEDSIIIQYYPSEGRAIVNRLPRRTLKNIMSRAHKLKITNKGWSEEEIDILIAKYPTQGSNIEELLKSKSKSSIVQKAKSLGIKFKIKRSTQNA